MIVLMGVVMFFCWYYPIGAYQNAVPTDAVTVRGVMVWLFLEQFLLFASTFAFLCVAGMDSSETASNIANLIFSLCLTFCG
jgi:ATP-binding cassette subfamily G (WHITE) protein 2 (PDR)